MALDREKSEAVISSLQALYQDKSMGKGRTWDTFKTEAETVMAGLSEEERSFVKSMAQHHMWEYDQQHKGDEQRGPNPYAGVVYSLFPLPGGS